MQQAGLIASLDRHAITVIARIIIRLTSENRNGTDWLRLEEVIPSLQYPRPCNNFVRDLTPCCANGGVLLQLQH